MVELWSAGAAAMIERRQKFSRRPFGGPRRAKGAMAAPQAGLRLSKALMRTVLAAFATLSPEAHAVEVKLGLFKHDVTFLGDAVGLGAAGKEPGVDVVGAVYFDRPFFKASGWSPRPYFIGSVNSGAGTDFIGGGLSWKFNFLRRFYFAPELGIVVHDGITNYRPFSELRPEEIPDQARTRQTRIEFGSRALFQPGFHFGVRANNRLSFEFSYIHLSNGQVLNGHFFGRARDANEGLDLIGGRIAYNFGRFRPFPRRR